MGFRVIYAPKALDDLENAVRYITRDNSEAALRLANRLADRAESLSDQPRRGSPLHQRPGIRKLICRPYLIVYRIDEPQEVIEILRFWHAKRDQRQMKLP